MCDTLGKIVSHECALFAKNSDRSPNEPQVIEYRPAKDHREDKVKVTYTTIEQVPHTYATLISRPIWMWGAEMGVNEYGVCIGNEAVFTKGKYSKEGLIGMDLVRIGLERGKNAKEALDVIISLLKQYGQGGNCGYDHQFLYDNAFLIMDRQEIYILETAKDKWVYKKVKEGSISNRLSIGLDGDVYSHEKCDFAHKYREPLYSHFSGSQDRLKQTSCQLPVVQTVHDMMTALRVHRDVSSPLTHGDVASTCMHAGGMVGDHTTSSMIVELKETITVWVTGSSLPCISLFKPWVFGSEAIAPVFYSSHIEEADAYWRYRDAFMRQTLGYVLPQEFYKERDDLEASWLKAVLNVELSMLAKKQEEDFYKKWISFDFDKNQGKRKFILYWHKKTEDLKIPAQKAIVGD